MDPNGIAEAAPRAVRCDADGVRTDRPTAGEHSMARDGVGHGFREGPTAGSSRSTGPVQEVDLPGPSGLGIEALRAKDSGAAGAPGLHRHGGGFLRRGRDDGHDLGNSRQ